MAMKLKITFGDVAIFEAEGDFAVDQPLVDLVSAVVATLGPEDQGAAQAKVDALARQAKANSDQLAGTVAAHSPTPVQA